MSTAKEMSMSEKISKKIDKPEPKYNNTGSTTLEKIGYFFRFIFELFNFFVIGAIKTFPTVSFFILGFIIYTIIIGYLFLKNPFDWINENNGGGAIFLALFGGFLMVISYFFYVKKKNLFQDESNTSNTTSISFFGKIITTMGLIGFIIFIFYVIFNFTAKYSDWSKYVFLMLNLLIFIGIIAILLKLFKYDKGRGEPVETKPSWLSLLKKIIFYFPCLLLDFVDYIKYEYSITTKPIVLLLIGEILLVALYFILPWLIDKIISHNSTLLQGDAINLNSEEKLGTFQEINFIPNINTGNKEFSYNYAISSWFFLDSFSPETNSNYSEYTSLLNIGDKPNIMFNVLKNKLKIMLKTQGKNEKILYETKDFKMQRWNHIVINYDGSNLDIFINNELVSSNPGVVPYNQNTNITSGTNEGIFGGICNVRYFRDSLSRGKISWLYNSVKSLNPPIF
jgi:hypothetical protein